jgi:hypothetical protein
MTRVPIQIRNLVTTITTVLLSGCFSVDLPPQTPPDGLRKLAQLSDVNLPVRISTDGLTDSRRGFQYLFMALPISRVHTPNLANDALTQLSVAGGLRGYSFRLLNDNETTPLYLDLRITDASVNGYDLLFIRKPTSTVSLDAKLIEGGIVKRECSVTQSASNTSHFAFSAELQSALGEALLQSSYKALDCLSLGAPYSSDVESIVKP